VTSVLPIGHVVLLCAMLHVHSVPRAMPAAHHNGMLSAAVAQEMSALRTLLGEYRASVSTRLAYRRPKPCLPTAVIY
jgi:hypothetical protein